jgi:hypothetical protein
VNWYIAASYLVTFALLALEVIVLFHRKKKLETQT